MRKYDVLSCRSACPTTASQMYNVSVVQTVHARRCGHRCGSS